MRTYLIAFAYLLLIMPQAWSESLTANSKLEDVVVFSDRALVSRAASLDLDQGTYEILFKGLPGALEPDSVSVKGEGTAKVKLFGARIVTEQLEVPQSDKVQDLERQIELLADQRKVSEDTKTMLEEKRKFLSSIRAASGDQIGKDLVTSQPVAGEVQKLSSYLDSEYRTLFQENAQADSAIRDINRKIDKLQRELDQLRSQQVKQAMVVAVDLEAETSGRFQLVLSYRVLGAGWEPVYEARADWKTKKIEFTVYGQIRQNTGEDWNQVRLELSTAKPSLSGHMPEIESWYLRRYEPPQPVPVRTAVMESKMAVQDSPAYSEQAGVIALEQFAAERAVAQVQDHGPTVHYELQKRETIASDWQPKKVSVAVYSFDGNFMYEATPRLSPYAYLRAKVKNQSPSVLLAGPVQIFLNGAYSGNSWIDLIGSNDTFDLFLGVNEQIRIEQKLLNQKTDVSVIPGVHGKVKTIDFQYLTTVENNQREDIQILLHDQIPVSQHDEIKIDAVTFNPEPVREDSEKRGVFEWAFKIPAGKKQTVKSSYRVKHPVDYTVEGLPR